MGFGHDRAGAQPWPGHKRTKLRGGEAHVTLLSVLSADPSPLEYSYSRLDRIPPVFDLSRQVGGNLWRRKRGSRGTLTFDQKNPSFLFFFFFTIA